MTHHMYNYPYYLVFLYMNNILLNVIIAYIIINMYNNYIVMLYVA